MTEAADLRSALDQSENGWFLDLLGDGGERRLEAWAAEIDAFAQEYERRFGERPDPLRLASSDPFRARAFFQPDTLDASVEAKVMVWRILLGCEIAAVDLHYADVGRTELNVELRGPYGEVEHYTGKGCDLRLLRHFGVVERNGRFVWQGYYAIR